MDLIPTSENAWRFGAMLEEDVAKILGDLSAAHWVVRHDVMIGRNWNVDHIAVGPPGVFALDAKFRSAEVKVSRGGVWVNGFPTDMAEKARASAREVSTRLSVGRQSPVWVQPVIVFDAEVSGRSEPRGVQIVLVEELFDFLRSAPRVLDVSSVQEIGRRLAADSTWLTY